MPRPVKGYLILISKYLILIDINVKKLEIDSRW